MERDIKLAYTCNVVSNVLELFVFGTSIEGILIVMLLFPPLVYQTFKGSFGIGEIFNCSEIYLQVLLLPP